MQWDTPKQNRMAILKRFSKQLEITPCLMDIQGENEWVDNYIKFGDLVAEKMGADAGEFYFEQLYELLLYSEKCDEVVAQVKQAETKSEVKISGTKQRQAVRGSSKRLF